ncbi:DNA mismatch repair protein MSH5-like [Rutidosis leptorrhynchoides]|uniref:DNA mismatch repair protein MSH5-like n=1 Tax=Rutidosis leptorrhynchoides TaxID=125765 RepID=UPI003A9A141A
MEIKSGWVNSTTVFWFSFVTPDVHGSTPKRFWTTVALFLGGSFLFGGGLYLSYVHVAPQQARINARNDYVALIVFLAHIGSSVPAHSATVSLTDSAMGSKLMTAEQSTFMIDLHQVKHPTSRSLCLLDEFGKGTLTEDDVGLLGGTIEHFISMYPPKSDKVKYYTVSILRPDDNSENIDEIDTIVLAFSIILPFRCSSRNYLDYTIKGIDINRVCNKMITAQDDHYKNAVEKIVAFDAVNGDLALIFKDIFPGPP